MSRPERQPGARVQKVRDPHPALSAGGGGGDVEQPGPVGAVPAAQTAPAAPAAPAAPTLVPFNARIPKEVHQDLRLLSAATGDSIQDLAAEALRTFIANHPDRIERR